MPDPEAANTIESKQQELVAEFQSMTDWQDRYRSIIQMGKALPDFPEEHRVDKNKVKGCQSQVWLHARLDGDRVQFIADSDATIVRGLIAILLRVFSGHTPDEIIEAEPHFINDIGLSENLSQTRANGLAAMIKQIKFYGIAFKTLREQMAARGA
jgi:cysteine desulfuration protein SufE